MKKLYAALEIGTQSAILSIGRVEEGKWVPKLEKVHPCRLGEGLEKTRHYFQRISTALTKKSILF